MLATKAAMFLGIKIQTKPQNRKFWQIFLLKKAFFGLKMEILADFFAKFFVASNRFIG